MPEELQNKESTTESAGPAETLTPTPVPQKEAKTYKLMHLIGTFALGAVLTAAIVFAPGFGIQGFIGASSDSENGNTSEFIEFASYHYTTGFQYLTGRWDAYSEGHNSVSPAEANACDAPRTAAKELIERYESGNLTDHDLEAIEVAMSDVFDCNEALYLALKNAYMELSEVPQPEPVVEPTPIAPVPIEPTPVADENCVDIIKLAKGYISEGVNDQNAEEVSDFLDDELTNCVQDDEDRYMSYYEDLNDQYQEYLAGQAEAEKESNAPAEDSKKPPVETKPDTNTDKETDSKILRDITPEKETDIIKR